jgi:membrane associated rhomboid family serine protease
VDQERTINGEGIPPVEPPRGPWSDLAAAEPPKEPLSKAPWPPLLIAAVLIAIYAWQTTTGDAAACTAGYARAACIHYGFAPGQLDIGQWYGLVTALFMHGSWAHVLFNSVFMVAFGAPVAKFFGLTLKGVLAFFAFFLVCGLAGNLGFAAVNPHSPTLVIGASGAIAGFMGAASRLLDRRTADGGFAGLAPFTSRTVVAMAAAWVVINGIVGVLGVDIGFGAPGQPVAWEAHLFGYAAGLLLIGPAAWMLGVARPPPQPST